MSEDDRSLWTRGAPKYVAAEMCHTLNFHWGTATRDFNYLSPAHVIEELCFARRAGANLLMNLGPEAHGKLPAYESAVLEKVGDWIEMMGGADSVIYEGRPCAVSGEGEDFALAMGTLGATRRCLPPGRRRSFSC